MNLREIAASLLDGTTKGIPPGVDPFPLGEIGAKGWNVLREDMPLPLAVLKQSAIDHNSQWMRRFLAASGASIAPHGKTTMSPQLFAYQLKDGAWGMTVATVQQMKVAIDAGCTRIVIANQVVGRAAVRYVFETLRDRPNLELYCLVDSTANVDVLAAAASTIGPSQPLRLLIEAGVRGGRAGCRAVDEALALARYVKAAGQHLALAGVEGFEGIIHGASAEAIGEAVTAFLAFVVEVARALDREQLFAIDVPILSAGGSAFYDLAVEQLSAAGLSRTFRVVTRSGCYLTHDAGLYQAAFENLVRRRPEIRALGPGPIPALELWAYVQSRPEPGKAIIAMGKRDVSFDVALPTPVWRYDPREGGQPRSLDTGYRTTGLNDQHCHLETPVESSLAVGEMIGFGISHPCTTFDKWQVVYAVDDEYGIVQALRTFF